MPSASTPALLNNPEPRGLKESWRGRDGESRLVRGDHLDMLASLASDSVDCIWTDPPYFLSNGGTTCHAGKRVAVHKGAWDQSQGVAADHAFNRAWLAECRRVLKPSGTIWVSGTHHVYLSVGMAMMELGYRLLNDIVWEKPNPPPNLGCRCFTHATEMILWAAKSAKGASDRYTFNYADMKAENDGRQMKNVWRFTAPGNDEKRHGKHPTQKPLALIERCLLASTHAGDLVVDPFAGSASTGVAALGAGRRFVGAEIDANYCKLAGKRLMSAELARDDESP
jgi:site-specific DNA-methyltransferase (adenine-specific)